MSSTLPTSKTNPDAPAPPKSSLDGYRKIRDHQTFEALVSLADGIEQQAVALVRAARAPLSIEHRKASLDTAGALNRLARGLRVRYGLPASTVRRP